MDPNLEPLVCAVPAACSRQSGHSATHLRTALVESTTNSSSISIYTLDLLRSKSLPRIELAFPKLVPFIVSNHINILAALLLLVLSTLYTFYEVTRYETLDEI